MYNEIELLMPVPPSLNKLYSQKHWSARSNMKNKYKEIVYEALQQYDPFFADTYTLDISYNCGYDIDNMVLASKFVSDSLKSLGYIKDDNPKHFKKLSLQKDEELEKGKIKVVIRYHYE